MKESLKDKLFPSVIFSSLQSNTEFKEDSVREVIILPLLKELGYKEENIDRSKTLKDPILKLGSNKKIPIKYYPDYSLKVENSYAWVLDAKSPNESVTSQDNIEQVYCYAYHKEIRSTYFALCNGVNFALYRTQSAEEPIFLFNLDEIDYHYDKLKMFLSPDSFQLGKNITYENTNAIKKQSSVFDYLNRPLLEEIVVKKQAAKRHFGVHGYFTKQSWNVVAEYIKNFTKPGDWVLDPFGGSGVTAIEAMMNNRKAINIDLNPMAVFIVQSLVAPINEVELTNTFTKIKNEYIKKEPKTDEEIDKALKKADFPSGFALPKGSDVDTVEQLFTDKQLVQLSFLKKLINQTKDQNIRISLLLAFSSTISKINRTYHNSNSRDENAGNAAAFAYYRYRVAVNEVDLNVIKTFETKFKRVLSAKKDMVYFINPKTIEDIKIIKDTATNLHWIPKESIDYIYTDPPYGKKIPYLDLSVMWTSWLDLDVTPEDYQQEAIVGGEHNKTKSNYNTLIAQSIKEMYRVLKYDRWMSFVFAHKDPEFWHLIIETAESCGFEYVGAVPQKNGQTSFKKRQNPFTVLSGQLIINFRKVRNPKSIMKANLGMDITQIIIQTIEGIIAKNNGATLEQINDELIIKGLELGFLDMLKKEYSDLTPLLLQCFDYNEDSDIYTIKKDSKFTTHIDVKLRINYYLISYLRRKEREKYNPHFDEIILYIMPLLKNGITPPHQTILSVLENIAVHIGDDRWKLRTDDHPTLF